MAKMLTELAQNEPGLIDQARFLQMFDEMAAIGGTPEGGVHRLAASAADGAARDLLQAWFAAEGMACHIDPLGNMAGILDLAGDRAPLVMAGSHLDSQPQGGRFDGALGVVAACAAAFTLRRAVCEGRLAAQCNLAVTNWTSEEGARFQPSLLGSGVFAGKIDATEALQVADRDGVTVGSALQAIDYAGHMPLPRPAAYVELHIECGPLLDQAGERLGIFTRHWGAVKRRIAFVGKQAHTGPTPMADRHDALLGAAMLIQALHEMCETASGVLHTSVGRIDVSPNSPNVVPGEAVLFVELRAVDPAVLEAAEAEMLCRAADAGRRARVEVQWRAVDRRPAGCFDAGLAALCAAEARALGIEPRDMATVPGHDAISLGRLCPSVMLVVPSVGGICHHSAEFTAPDDIALGAEVLTRVLWRLCRDGVAS